MREIHYETVPLSCPIDDFATSVVFAQSAIVQPSAVRPALVPCIAGDGDALHRAGLEVVYVEYPHATHFYWISLHKIAGSWDTVAPEVLAFLGQHLQPAS